MKKHCPVCNYSELKEEIMICPNCKSNLEIFKHLNKSQSKHRSLRILSVFLTVLLFLGVITGIYSFYRINTAVEWRDNLIAELNNDRAYISEQLAYCKNDLNFIADKYNSSHKEKAEVAEQEPKKKKETKKQLYVSTNDSYKIYTVKKGDCLWLIALKFYEDGGKYIKIAKDNELPDADKIIAGTELKIYYE